MSPTVDPSPTRPAQDQPRGLRTTGPYAWMGVGQGNNARPLTPSLSPSDGERVPVRAGEGKLTGAPTGSRSSFRIRTLDFGLWILVTASIFSMCATLSVTAATNEVRLIALDPGHFHAGLVQKFMYPQVSPVVHVYAPAGPDLAEYLKRIEGFNTRADQPTRWEERVYTGPDFLQHMLHEKAGNVVVLAGNNAHKIEYIYRSVSAGFNVLADKPMAI